MHFWSSVFMYARINRWGFYSLTITVYILIHGSQLWRSRTQSEKEWWLLSICLHCQKTSQTMAGTNQGWVPRFVSVFPLCSASVCTSYYYLPSTAFTHATSLSARQMINHILVWAPSQYRLNQCCFWNISSLMSFPISCVNIPPVDGSNTDFACTWGRDETSVEVKPTWTSYLMFNCVIYKETSLVTHAAIRPKVNLLFRPVRSPGADWLVVRRQLIFFNHFCQL